jgi:high-affinity iron transporter
MTTRLRRLGPLALGVAGLLVFGLLIWQGIAQHGSPPDPSDPESGNLTAGMVVIDSGILVFREGLETILVLAAITASFLGANAVYRRPVAVGAGAAMAATVATWFIVVAIIDAVNAPALAIQAATGLLAIVVLLVVMNWFFHRVYWAGWIGHHQRRRRRLFEGDGERSQSSILLGVALLGFTSVYREGFEVVLFLQNLRLQRGTGLVLAGVAVGLALTAVVGVFTFVAHHHLPYKKMLVLTGVMLGVVLLIMVGENVQEMQLAGWLPTTAIGLPIPDWMGLWLAIFPNVEGVIAQLVAAAVVLGSYFVAQDVRVRRPRLRGEAPARRPEQSPAIGAAPTTMRNETAGSR